GPLLIAFCLVGFSTWGQSQTPEKQQRPRRVGESETKPGGDQKPGGQEVDEGDVVRVDTQLVSVPTIVTNNVGRPIAGLNRQNFVVYEDGQKQSITNFGTTEAPFEIALLLDTSGSTRVDVALIRQAANAFIDALRPGDRVAVIAFNSLRSGTATMATVEVLANLTEDRKTLHHAIEDLGSSNGTPYYDALLRVSKQIFASAPRDEVRGRRAIVALTDGVDSTSDSDFATARASLMQHGIACYFVQVNTEDFVEDRLLKDC